MEVISGHLQAMGYRFMQVHLSVSLQLRKAYRSVVRPRAILSTFSIRRWPSVVAV
jgi:hypothetical protein